MVTAESASPRALDELDQALLRELRGNGRTAISELARRVGGGGVDLSQEGGRPDRVRGDHRLPR